MRRSNDRLKLGRSLLESGACRSALPHFEAAEKFAPKSPTAPGAVGLAYRCIGDSTRALAAFKRSLALDPNQPALAAEVAKLGG